MCSAIASCQLYHATAEAKGFNSLKRPVPKAYSSLCVWCLAQDQAGPPAFTIGQAALEAILK